MHKRPNIQHTRSPASRTFRSVVTVNKNNLLWMHTKKPTNKKRQHISTTTDSDSDNENTQQIHNWPRFLLIQSADSEIPLSKLSPFAVQKGIEGIAGIPKEIKRLR